MNRPSVMSEADLEAVEGVRGAMTLDQAIKHWLPHKQAIGWANWVQGDINAKAGMKGASALTAEQHRCFWALSCLHTGPYNLDIKGTWASTLWTPKAVRLKIAHAPDLSTFDFDRLTLLVLQAHRFNVRVSIEGGPASTTVITAFARDPYVEEGWSTSHPGLNELVQRIGRMP